MRFFGAVPFDSVSRSSAGRTSVRFGFRLETGDHVRDHGQLPKPLIGRGLTNVTRPASSAGCSSLPDTGRLTSDRATSRKPSSALFQSRTNMIRRAVAVQMITRDRDRTRP